MESLSNSNYNVPLNSSPQSTSAHTDDASDLGDPFADIIGTAIGDLSASLNAKSPNIQEHHEVSIIRHEDIAKPLIEKQAIDLRSSKFDAEIASSSGQSPRINDEVDDLKPIAEKQTELTQQNRKPLQIPHNQNETTSKLSQISTDVFEAIESEKVKTIEDTNTQVTQANTNIKDMKTEIASKREQQQQFKKTHFKDLRVIVPVNGKVKLGAMANPLDAARHMKNGALAKVDVANRIFYSEHRPPSGKMWVTDDDGTEVECEWRQLTKAQINDIHDKIAKYTALHNEIAALQKQIDRVEEMRKKELDKLHQPSSDTPLAIKSNNNMDPVNKKTVERTDKNRADQSKNIARAHQIQIAMLRKYFGEKKAAQKLKREEQDQKSRQRSDSINRQEIERGILKQEQSKQEQAKKEVKRSEESSQTSR
jgi:hypothetical protein